MLKNDMFNNINILEKCLDATWLRNKVISDNIANVDTPEYKRKKVKFESMLQQAYKINNKIDRAQLNSIQPKIVEDNTNLINRLDGNNVDIEVEMVERVKNELRYNALINQVSYQFKMFQTVLRK